MAGLLVVSVVAAAAEALANIRGLDLHTATGADGKTSAGLSYRLRLTSVFSEFPAQDWSGTLTVDRARTVVVPVLRPSD